MSRLDFAPDTDAMEVTDISTGHFVFSPVSGQPVAYESLDEAITGAGYEIEKASIVVTGRLVIDEQVFIQVPDTQQVFELKRYGELERLLSDTEPNSKVTVTGSWFEEKDTQIIEIQRWSLAGSQ